MGPFRSRRDTSSDTPPRELAELDAMKDLQDARRALEQAVELTAGARQALQDATAHHELARREVRRISELGRVR